MTNLGWTWAVALAAATMLAGCGGGDGSAEGGSGGETMSPLPGSGATDGGTGGSAGGGEGSGGPAAGGSAAGGSTGGMGSGGDVGSGGNPGEDCQPASTDALTLTGSCLTETGCSDQYDTTFGAAALKSICSGQGGTWSTEACSVEPWEKTCTQELGADVYVHYLPESGFCLGCEKEL